MSATNIGQNKCEHCHRKLENPRLSIAYLIQDAVSTLFNLERGVLFTAWELIKNPGNVVREFVQGDRLKYFNPFRLMVVAATLAVLVESLTGTIESVGTMDLPMNSRDVNSVISQFIKEYLNIIVLLTAPILSIGSYIVFRKHKWNLAEHLVVNTYAYSIPALVGSVYSVCIMFFPPEERIYLEGFSQLLLFYVAYVYISTWKIHWFRGILAFILSLIISFAVITFLSVVLAMIL